MPSPSFLSYCINSNPALCTLTIYLFLIVALNIAGHFRDHFKVFIIQLDSTYLIQEPYGFVDHVLFRTCECLWSRRLFGYQLLTLSEL